MISLSVFGSQSAILQDLQMNTVLLWQLLHAQSNLLAAEDPHRIHIEPQLMRVEAIDIHDMASEVQLEFKN